MNVSRVRFIPGTERDVRAGLLGWASFLVDGGLELAGVAVRRTQTGRLALSFPVRDDGWGRRWPYIRPVDDATRMAIEKAVITHIKGDMA
jgi:hypothetical protein